MVGNAHEFIERLRQDELLDGGEVSVLKAPVEEVRWRLEAQRLDVAGQGLKAEDAAGMDIDDGLEGDIQQAPPYRRG